MNIRIFNICLLLGWLMVTGGTALAVSPGWGLVTGGALLLVLTLAAAYLAGWEQPARTRHPDQHQPEHML